MAKAKDPPLLPTIVQIVLRTGSEYGSSDFIRERAYLMSFMMVWIGPTGPMHHRTISPMLVLSSTVPAALGCKRIKMAVVQL